MKVYQFAKSLVLPPALPFLVVLIGGLGKLAGLDPHGAVFLLGLGLLYLLSIPWAGQNLLALLCRLVPGADAGDAEPPAAIVVLSGDLRPALRDGAMDLGPLSLERVRHAARLARETGLPILVAGRAAPVMAAVLPGEFGVPVKWVEARSRRTSENAAFSAEMLRAAGIGSAWIVTQDWHMPRALRAFRAVGLRPSPAPASRSPAGRLSVAALIPSRAGVAACHFAVHEALALLRQRLGGGA